MPGLRHRRRASLIVPEHPIQTGGICGIGPREIHFRGNVRAGSIFAIGLVNESIPQIAEIGLESGLIARTCEQSAHDWRIRIVLIHGRQPEQNLDGVYHVHSGIETMFDVRPRRRTWRIVRAISRSP